MLYIDGLRSFGAGWWPRHRGGRGRAGFDEIACKRVASRVVGRFHAQTFIVINAMIGGDDVAFFHRRCLDDANRVEAIGDTDGQSNAPTVLVG